MDNGGTYIKAAIFDQEGNQIGAARKPNQSLCPKPGYAEYDQGELWKANCLCMREVLAKTKIQPEEIACIGISAQGCGFYAVDKEGRDIRNAISSSDKRAKRQVQRWKEDGTGKAAYPDIYRETQEGHLNAILAWLKEEEPESYGKIHRIFSMKDFLIYRLTGEEVAGFGCQSASGLMNIREKRFDGRLAALFGLDGMEKKFGRLCWDTALCGRVTEEAAGLCGCKPGTLVAAGSHDVVAAALAMGITDSSLCFLLTGTHGINGYLSREPVLNGTIKYNELFAVPGWFLIEEGYPSSSATLEWVIELLFPGEHRSRREIYQEINQAVLKAGEEKDKLFFLPFLRGQRDNERARGCFIGMRPEHTREDCLRAVYKGVAFSHLMQMEHLFANRKRPEKLRMAGGAANSSIWVKIFADVFGIPMEVVPGEEMSAKGAAIAAAAACGFYPDVGQAVKAMTRPGQLVLPCRENVFRYAEEYAGFQRLVKTLDGLWEHVFETGGMKK